LLFFIEKPQILALHLHKSASLEWFPGCEWWDRVFPFDEPIDTLTCSIHTNIDQLPQQAIQRADQEHQRFIHLPLELQEKELNHLLHSKQVIINKFINHSINFMINILNRLL